MMKKIAHIMLAAAGVLAAGACERDKALDAGAFGTLDMSSITHSVVVTRGTFAEASTRGGETDGYTVELWQIRNDGEHREVFTRPLSECAGAETLRIGTYRLRVSSGRCPAAGWETPWYAGTVDVEIENGGTASVGDVECTLGNVKVTVGYGDSLLALLDKNSAKVTVSVTAGRLEFLYGEVRGGYLAVDGTTEMTVTFSGTVDTAPMEVSETITVAPGEWQRIRYVLEGDNTFPVMTLGSGAGQLEDGGQWF